MTQTLRELDTAITNVGDKSSLDAFIDKLRVAESQLGRVKAETKAITQDNKIQIKAETLKNKLDVKFLGQLSKEDVFKKMKEADIFILPSKNETFGMVYMEALSFGMAGLL